MTSGNRRDRDRFYRHQSAVVLQMYYELESGSLPGREFDVRVLDYRLDIERVFRTLPRPQQALLLDIYRDGVSEEDAAARVNATVTTVAEAEVALGRLLETHQLLDVEAYLNS